MSGGKAEARDQQSRLDGARLTAFVATTDAPRSVAFYKHILGLRMVSEDRFAIVFDANGTELRIQKVEALVPHPFTSLGWQVERLESIIRDLAARGVSFERYPGLPQDDLGIWSAPSGARVAWFKDPDDNLLSIAQYAR
ncbi:MAG: VOC family protein [Gemmatimonadaceae bacterium]